MTVRTRFAPSPTGFLHIGGLRTALYSFLHARHSGGEFVLRIEDTDRTRLVEGAMQDILHSLQWLGISWDEGPRLAHESEDTESPAFSQKEPDSEGVKAPPVLQKGPHGPYIQSERRELYEQYANQLIESGNAYPCFCSPEQLAQVREEQKKQGQDPGYDRTCRSLPPDEGRARREAGEPCVIRFAFPTDGETTFTDLIRGEITTRNSIMDDFVLLKSDGFPTYHLANVVDDHLMHITHVVRGDEWISSTPRHVQLYRGFGWEPPAFAHVPVILAPGGGKLSKRHGATMVREFRERGYLPEAMLNFIALLGWSLDDRTEMFTMEQLIQSFDIEKVNKAPAVFSYEKLDHFNGVYIRGTSPEQLLDLLLPFIVKSGLLQPSEIDTNREYLLSIVPLIQERITLLGEIGDHIWFFFDHSFKVKEPQSLIPRKAGPEDAHRILAGAKDALSGLDPFTDEQIEQALRGLVNELSLKVGQVFMTLRVAVTGSKVSPGLFETIRVLGRERTLKRLEAAGDLVP